jgi:integral membrane protein
MTWMKTNLGRLRVTGWAEGISFLLLLGVAMPLKYLAGYPGAVRIVGMAHGVLFILYVLVALQAARAHRWDWRRTGWVLLASLLPAGPFLVESWILRSDSKPAAVPAG